MSFFFSLFKKDNDFFKNVGNETVAIDLHSIEKKKIVQKSVVIVKCLVTHIFFKYPP